MRRLELKMQKLTEDSEEQQQHRKKSVLVFIFHSSNVYLAHPSFVPLTHEWNESAAAAAAAAAAARVLVALVAAHDRKLFTKNASRKHSRLKKFLEFEGFIWATFMHKTVCLAQAILSTHAPHAPERHTHNTQTMQALCRVPAPGVVSAKLAGKRQRNGVGGGGCRAPAAVKPRTRVVRRATETEEPTEMDFAVFNSVVGGGDWEVVQQQVRAAAVEGKITPGVLGAAYTAGSVRV